ncbi:hypothetical protein J5X84_13225 [Streptosporangiaceae bacterium NEAU-GS5]|nr:hypothetical protein [Streptosporangiaceae bacterium NEAU-GS5]
MLKRLIVAAAVTALGGSLLTGSAHAAKAAPPDIDFVGISPGDSVPIGTRPVTVTIKFSGEADNLTAKVRSISNPSASFDLAAIQHGGTWVFQKEFPPEPGYWQLEVNDSNYAVRFSLQYPARIVRFDTRPRKVHKGDEVTSSGRLQVKMNHQWQALPDTKVTVLFLPADGSAGTATDVRTDAQGKFSLTSKPDRSGSYSVRKALDYDAKNGPVDETKGIYVKVTEARRGK